MTPVTLLPAVPVPVVGISLKMYLDRARTRAYLDQLVRIGAEFGLARGGMDVFVLPGFLEIREAAVLLAGSGIAVGGQDVCWADEGAYTGQVSAPMLAGEGCRYAEVGHAGRRRMFGEDDAMTAAKAAAAARAGLVPVVCVGEERRVPAPEAVAATLPQVTTLLDALPPGSEVLFAYEPVWAIGADHPAPGDHVVEVVTGLRAAVARPDLRCRFVYGGSAGPGTFSALKGLMGGGSPVDGLFLGRFAHDPQNLRQILAEVADAANVLSTPSAGAALTN